MLMTAEQTVQRREAELKSELERQARVVAEAEAKRKSEEAEQQRVAAVKAEQERQAKAAAEAEAKRKREEAEQQRLAALQRDRLAVVAPPIPSTGTPQQAAIPPEPKLLGQCN